MMWSNMYFLSNKYLPWRHRIAFILYLYLTHWGRVTHICVSKLTIVGSDNGLSPDRCQAIIWTNAGLLLILPLGNLNRNSNISIQKNAYESVVGETVAILPRPQCVEFTTRFYCANSLFAMLFGCGISIATYKNEKCIVLIQIYVETCQYSLQREKKDFVWEINMLYTVSHIIVGDPI